MSPNAFATFKLSTKSNSISPRGKVLEATLTGEVYGKYLSILHEDFELSINDEITEANDTIVRAIFLYPGQIETLKAIHDQGPLFDGDIPSKAARDYLLITGLVSKVVVKGEQGFNACTYKGSRVLRLIKEMKLKC